MLLGSTSVKAVQKTLMKLTLEVLKIVSKKTRTLNTSFSVFTFVNSLQNPVLYVYMHLTLVKQEIISFSGSGSESIL